MISIMHCRTLSGEYVDVYFSWTKQYPATYDSPAEGGFEEITEVFWKTRSGERVDVAPVLSDDDIRHLIDQILKDS